MPFFRRLVLCFIILWLPVQGFAAIAMPFCKHALGHSAVAQTASDPHEHHQHHKHQGEAADGNLHGSGLMCDDCGACRLACSALVVPVVLILCVPVAQSSFVLPSATPLHSFFPEQPCRPPLGAIA